MDEVESGEVYVVAGHNGKKGWLEHYRRMASPPGRGTLEKDKPPILGLIQRGGKVVLHMLANVQQATIKPIIAAAIVSGSLVHTDAQSIYARLTAWATGIERSATPK